MKAKRLKAGDHVAVIAPSSPASKEQISHVKKYMEDLGLKYDLLPSCLSSHGHFAGDTEIRLKDLHDAFLNYDGVICLKGGYGSPRLLPHIDYDLIKNNPKVFLGYSDITGLHMAIYNKTGLRTFHGPMASTALDDYSLDSIRKQVFEGYTGEIINPDEEEIMVLNDGHAKGALVGGNLSLLVSTLGSPYEIDTKDKIFFIEEVSEATYRIDRMLTSLMLAGKFDHVKGVILGTFSHCKPEDIKGKKRDLELVDVIKEIILPYNKPTIMNLRAGHNYPQITLPLGSQVEIKGHQVFISEAGVE